MLGQYGLNHDRTDPSLLATYKQELPDFTLADVIGTQSLLFLYLLIITLFSSYLTFLNPCILPGSPYAVVEYTVNPELGTEADLIALRKRLAQRGMRLMLDFVPNHSAVDCASSSSLLHYHSRS